MTEKKEIWVARGTYYPSDISEREDSFCLVSGISMIEDNVSTSGKPDIDNATSNFVYEPNLYSGR